MGCAELGSTLIVGDQSGGQDPSEATDASDTDDPAEASDTADHPHSMCRRQFCAVTM
jgi:hypothetical protein